MEIGDAVSKTVADGETTTSVVVAAIACVTDSTVAEVPPLHHSVDPGALDGLFDPTRRGRRRGHVEFDHDGCDVSVCYDGEVTVAVAPPE